MIRLRYLGSCAKYIPRERIIRKSDSVAIKETIIHYYMQTIVGVHVYVEVNEGLRPVLLRRCVELDRLEESSIDASGAVWR